MLLRSALALLSIESTRNSPSIRAPLASNCCTYWKLLLSYETTKPPLASAATAGRHWLPEVSVLTRNSTPTVLPSAA